MTDREKKIAEIREALEKATPGPWEIVDIGGIEIARDYKYKDGKHCAYWIAEMYQDEDMDEDQVYADAHLIANAPEWLGFLLDELDRIQQEYAEERAAHNAHVTELCELEKENRKLRERLKEEIVWQDECLKLEEQLQSAHQEIERLREENEGRKKIIEAYMRIEHDLAEDAERYLQQRDKLIEVLRWYADEDTHMIKRRSDGDYAPIVLDHGKRARDILKEIGVTVEPDRLHDARLKIAKARFSPERLVGESEAFGNDCPGERCEF